MEKDLMFQEFYGHTAGRFCQEVYVLCYNEFLEAIRCVKEKIQETCPDRKEEIHTHFSSFLLAISNSLDTDMERFVLYFTKNFLPPPFVPLHGVEIQESKGASEEIKIIGLKIMATNQLNTSLIDRIKSLQVEIERRKDMLAKLKEQKIRIAELQEAKRLLLELKKETALDVET